MTVLTRATAVCGAAVLTAVALGACQQDAPSVSAPTADTSASAPATAAATPTPATASEAPTTDAPAPTSEEPTGTTGSSTNGPASGGSTGAAPATTKAKKWHVAFVKGGPATDDETWPDAKDVFTPGEIQAIVPNTTQVKVADCDRGEYAFGGKSGEQTARNVTCKFDLVGAGVDGEPANLTVDLRGFGGDAEMTKAFRESYVREKKDDKTVKDIQNIKGYNGIEVYDKGQYGAKLAFTDGATTNMLLSNGTMAGEIWVTITGVSMDDDYYRSQQKVTRQLAPKFIKTLAPKIAK